MTEENELEELLEETRAKLNFQDIIFPDDLTVDIIYENQEMISALDEDSITLFKEGIVTKLELIERLQR